MAGLRSGDWRQVLSMSNLPCGHVYFLVMQKASKPEYDFGLVKIGITWGDVVDRIADLQTGNPYDLRCFESFETTSPSEVEHFMHRTRPLKMEKNEWLRCGRGQLRHLVDEARDEAGRIEKRKSKEQGCVAQISNGQVRPPTREELELHAGARELKEKLVPAKLRLEIAENWLKAATRDTLGIPGIVRANYVPATTSFNAGLAESKFADLASQCRLKKPSGEFRWRKMPQPHCFSAEYQAARVARRAAKASADGVLQSSLHGWTDRTPDMERWHDEFLRETGTVHYLDADLAELKTDLTVRLEDYDALDSVCIFKRGAPELDSATFRKTFPEKSEQCKKPVAHKLPKHVYPTRSYLQADELTTDGTDTIGRPLCG